ncbi:MAG: hypothetical protein H7222_17530 [Methylotenera sp.]|nr:hypothetical protein [Oligoflexia bacterium]
MNNLLTNRLAWTAAFACVASFGLSVEAVNVQAAQIEVADAPDSDLALTLSAISGARRSLAVNIYELTSPQIADALLERIKSGIHVDILEEGQPVGGLATAARGIQTQLIKAMHQARNGDHFFEMTSNNGTSSVKRRFAFDHAKYIVVDGDRLLVGSENYSPTGNPETSSVGNRGWEVLIHDPALAQSFQKTFTQDISLSVGDVLDLTAQTLTSNLSADDWEAFEGELTALADANSSTSAHFATFDSTGVQRITSPETSLSGLVGMIRSATRTLDIQQMTFEASWKSTAGNSPLLDEVVAAARRGVKVRVLLNDESVFNHGNTSKSKNPVTARLLNQVAAKEKLNLSAKVANLKAMGVGAIHNKGALVDGNRTLISSINWGENSVLRNRETAVLITSPGVNGFYENLFDQDWNAGVARGRMQNDLLVASEVNFEASESFMQSECPESLSLSVKFGTFTVTDSQDKDFEALSGKVLQGKFLHAPSAKGCILMETPADDSSTKQRFLELRKDRKGVTQVIFEGYTAVHVKLYSVRARIGSGEVVKGTHSATLYDGSGSGREKLTPAEMTVSELVFN